MDFYAEALIRHEAAQGKIETVAKLPIENVDDLSVAYTPGVAEPCRKIAQNIDDAYRYTCKANTIAVVSNGTAVLGLGNIGPLAGEPVMEGKGMLFKMFADVDVFDLELATTDPDELINVVKTLEPTFLSLIHI